MDTHRSIQTTQLDQLRYHWADAYVIEGSFIAMRRDTGAVLIAPDAETLRALIHADYFACPVSRPSKSSRWRPTPPLHG